MNFWHQKIKVFRRSPSVLPQAAPLELTDQHNFFDEGISSPIDILPDARKSDVLQRIPGEGTLVHFPPTPWTWFLYVPIFLVSGVGQLIPTVYLIRAIREGNAPEVAMMLIVFLVCIVSFLGFSSHLFWRTAFKIDNARANVTARSGPFWPMFSTTYPSQDFNAVVFSAEFRKRSSGELEPTSYLELSRPSGHVRLVREVGEFKEIKYLAEDVARLMNIDFIDRTQFPPVRYPSHAIGLSLKESVRKNLSAGQKLW